MAFDGLKTAAFLSASSLDPKAIPKEAIASPVIIVLIVFLIAALDVLQDYVPILARNVKA